MEAAAEFLGFPLYEFTSTSRLVWAHSQTGLRVPRTPRAKAARPFESEVHSVENDMIISKFFRYPERERFMK